MIIHTVITCQQTVWSSQSLRRSLIIETDDTPFLVLLAAFRTAVSNVSQADQQHPILDHDSSRDMQITVTQHSARFRGTCRRIDRPQAYRTKQRPLCI